MSCATSDVLVRTWKTGCCPQQPERECFDCEPCPDPDCQDADYVNPAELRSFMAAQRFSSDDLPGLLSMVGGVSRLFDDACELPHGSFRIAPEEPYLLILKSFDADLLPLPFHVAGSIVRVGVAEGQQATCGCGGEHQLSPVITLPPTQWVVLESGFLKLRPYSDNGNTLSIPGSYLPELRGFASQRCVWSPLVHVCARWGWHRIPQDVKEAVAEYVAQVYRKRDPQVALQIGLPGAPFTTDDMPLSWKMAVRRHKVTARKLRGARFA